MINKCINKENIMDFENTYIRKPKQRKPRKRNAVQQFEKKWGIHVNDLAEQECVLPEAIFMRVRNYGSPWQRKAKPTPIERKYGKTVGEIAHETNQHPVTVQTNFRERGDAYWEPKKGPTKLRGLKHNDSDWKSLTRYNNFPWLHPNHPDYSAWRNCTLFQD